jgi:hypothetical protein
MNEMQLYLITFEYFDYKCYLPRIFKNDYWTIDQRIDFCQKVIDKLGQDECIKKLYVHHAAVGSYEEIYNAFLSILKAPNPKVQYLKIEDRKLYDKRYINELDEERYTKMLINEVSFPIRVIDKQTGQDTDESFLPIVVIEEIIDKK